MKKVSAPAATIYKNDQGVLAGAPQRFTAPLHRCHRLDHAPGAGSERRPVRYNYKIDSQPLGTALQEFAKQSGVQIIFFSQMTEGLQALALNGSYTIAGALEVLHSGSHLIFRVINPKTIEICPSTATSLVTIGPLRDSARN